VEHSPTLGVYVRGQMADRLARFTAGFPDNAALVARVDALIYLTANGRDYTRSVVDYLADAARQPSSAEHWVSMAEDAARRHVPGRIARTCAGLAANPDASPGWVRQEQDRLDELDRIMVALDASAMAGS
jgi:hypothetical protein